MTSAPARAGDLVPAPLRLLTDRIAKARHRVLLASPFIGRAVTEYLGAIVEARAEIRPTLDRRALTSLTRGAMEGGFSSAAGLDALMDCGFEIRSIANLHAKLFIVDDWALVGSNNLTGGGLNGGNVELGVVLRNATARDATAHFEKWWEFATEDDVVLRSDLPVWRRRERKAAPRGRSAAVRGRILRTMSDEEFDRFQRAGRSAAAVAALRAGITEAGSGRIGVRLTKMPASHTAAYRQCRALREADPKGAALTRQLLTDVLLGHREADARAHAAFRLANDEPLRTDSNASVIKALRKASAEDPSPLVKRQARRMLAILSTPDPTSTRPKR